MTPPNHDLAALLREAQAAAAPAARPPRVTWVPWVPVVEQLLAKKYTLADSIRWLITKGAIPPDQETRAYRSLSALLKRRHAASGDDTR